MSLRKHKISVWFMLLVTFTLVGVWGITSNRNILFIMVLSTVFSIILLLSLIIRIKCTVTGGEEIQVIPAVGITRYDFGECQFFMDDPPECPICIQRMRVGCELPCKHYFHKECIDEWLKRGNTCPVCRGNMINIP